MSLTPLRLGKGGPAAYGRRAFLPTTRDEMRARGWEELDVLIVTGDAYVDHPAFGPILVARFLEGRGYRVGVVAQPRWDSPDDIARMGRPRLFVGISAGNLDSMLNKLTAQKKVRGEDLYSPGGRTNMRPNRASIVYCNLARQAFPGLPVILGGIEASLRRIAHYDYWSDSVRRSMVLDSKADLLVFGMGELAAWEIARRLDAGEKVEELRDVRGTAYAIGSPRVWEPLLAQQSRYTTDRGVVVLPSYEEVSTSKEAFARMARGLQFETNAHNGRPLLQVHGREAVYFNPPAPPLSEEEMDGLYDLPFVRVPHPSYGAERIPAYDTVKHSIVSMRGCFGGCTFCSITEHEGRIIQSRSEASVLREVREMSRMEGFSGVITDVGGPTANMYQMHCKDERTESACRRLSCVHPGICDNLVTDHAPLVKLLKSVRKEPGIKRVFVASGVRYDLAMRSPEFIRELAAHHTGGQLSVAPEHSDPEVLDKMKKPPVENYERFAQAFCQASEQAGKDQYLVPYFISGHPGSTLKDTIALALWLKRRGMRPRQVQDFIPTPMAIATAMYHTGLDPLTGKPVPVARDLREKRMMKALLLYWDPQHWPLAREALRKAGRADLIGGGPHALVGREGAERGAAAGALRGRQGRKRKPSKPRPRT
ncbi:MAG TPA: YgiQ family radical SAM protein [Polyangiaceae bacterium]|nr:YgiQ family radical SAM protein [Polyangiaceae bacterium]